MFLKSSIKLVLLVAILAIVSGCERAKEIDVEPAGFRLISPTGTVTEVEDDTQLAIAFTGNIDTSAIRIFLNDVDVTNQVNISPTAAYVLLKDLNIQSGRNDIRVVDLASGVSETFSIYIDSLPPSIAITNIIPSTPLLGTTNSPTPGTPFRVRGKIIDTSPVDSLVFTDANGTHNATITGTAPNQEFDVILTYPDRSDPAYNPNVFPPLAIYNTYNHWVTSEPDFTYTIVDTSGQTVSESFVVKDSRFAKAVDGFVSYSAFDVAEYLLNNAAKGAIEQNVDSTVIIGDDDNDPFQRAFPSGFRTDPELDPSFPRASATPLVVGSSTIDYSSCQSGPDGQDYCPTSLDQIGPSIVPYGDSYCSASVFDSAKVTHCAFYITRVKIVPPDFGFGWENKSSTPKLNAIVRLPYSVIDVQIVGLKYFSGVQGPNGLLDLEYTYQGALKTSIEFKSFQLKTSVDVTKGQAPQPTKEAYVPKPDTTDLIQDSGVDTQLNPDPATRLYSVDILDENGVSIFPPVSFNVTALSDVCVVGTSNLCINTTSEEEAELAVAEVIRDKLVDDIVNLAGINSVSAIEREGNGFTAYKLNVSPTTANLTFTRQSFGDLFLLSRSGKFKLDMEGFNKAPNFDNSSCNICKIGPGSININIEFLATLFNYNLLSKLRDDLNSMIESQVEALVGPLLDNSLAGFQNALDQVVFGEKTLSPILAAPNGRSIQFDLYGETLNIVKQPFYVAGMRFGMNGSVKSMTEPVSADKAGLGSLFVKQGSHNDWMFYDKITPSKKPNDFAFSLSSNILNQYFQAAHESGIFDGMQLNVSGANFASTSSNINIPAGNSYTIDFKTIDVPTVQLIPAQSEISYDFCLMFQGFGNCGRSNQKVVRQSVEPQMLINFPFIEIKIVDTVTGATLLDADIGLSLHAALNGTKLQPRRAEDGSMDFVSIKIIQINSKGSEFSSIPDAYLDAQTASLLVDAFNSVGSGTDNLLSLGTSDETAAELFTTTESPLFIKFLGDVNALPLEIGVNLSVLEIDPGGDFINVAGNIEYNQITDCMAAFPSKPYLRSVCIQ